MIIQKRSIAMCIVLTIVTCGIYGLYWLYCLQQDTNEVTNHPNDTDPMVVVLLNIVTCGIYGAYWAYRQGEKFQEYYASVNEEAGTLEAQNLPLIYLALSIANYFTGFCTLINYALMQERINNIIDADNGFENPDINIVSDDDIVVVEKQDATEPAGPATEEPVMEPVESTMEPVESTTDDEQ